MCQRTNIMFKSDDIILKGWFYTPSNQDIAPAPCVIMTHGFSALKEHYLDKFATRFAQAGMCVLVYDNRNFGDSEGAPRFEVDPFMQIQDMKNAITYLQQRKEVNAKKIGLWGTSFSGGIVLVVAATDNRVKCVVTQVPFISGHHKFLQQIKPEQWEVIKKKYHAENLSRMAGHEPTMIPVVTDNLQSTAIMKIPSAFSFFTSVKFWENKVTLRSIENAGEFEPISYIRDIDDIPVLFIVANKDTINATNCALEAYNKTRSPKKLVMIEGDHFVPYSEQFERCVNSAHEWFAQYFGLSN
ncbi:MAG: alpha/beta fold hydrolase [Gammaproteobacteria bacterium]|nr:MAG: alpha/beta fold hydrolase [Gammaproteobacteria bacterium]